MIQGKTDADLAALQQRKLEIVYLGLESGSDEVPRRVHQGIPGSLIAFKHAVDQMVATVPHFASPIEEAEYWAHAFGP